MEAGTIDVVSDTFQEEGYIAVSDGSDTIVKIPEDGNNEILINAAYDDEESFSMLLPDEANGKAEISDEGTVVYQNDEGSTLIGVQAIQDLDSGMEGVRSLITINDSTASKEYQFTFNLEEGTKLMYASDYLKIDDKMIQDAAQEILADVKENEEF